MITVELTSVSGHPTLSSKFVAYATHRRKRPHKLPDRIFKELLPGTVPDKERKLYARFRFRQQLNSQKITLLSNLNHLLGLFTGNTRLGQ
jgi:hypothetical protein